MSKRTTVRLPEDLLKRAKRKAAAEGRTLTSLIEKGCGPLLPNARDGRRRRDPCRGSAQPRAA